MVLLTEASRNLFTRPPEEHYPSFEAIQADASAQRDRCTEHDAKDTTILFSENGQSVHFGDLTFDLTPYALAQLAAMAKVPMPVLERINGETRAKVLNQCFPRNKRWKCALADGDHLRAITSDRYERVFDADVLEEVNRWLLGSGFIPAVPTINTDEHGTNVMGNTKPALFRSDRDMFAFFYSDKQPGDDGLGGLRKGVFVWNSEVGHKSFGFSTFWHRETCSNMLVWDASDIRTRRARHTGRVKHVVREFHEDLVRIGSEITTAEYDVFQRAKETPFVPHGTDEHSDVIKRLNKEFKVSEADAREIVELAYLEENPGDLSVWGIVNGITSSAKAHRYAEARTRMGVLAGRVLATAS